MTIKLKRAAPLLEKEIGPLTFGRYCRAARNLVDMSQADLARKLGIARGTLCDIEKGRQLVSVKLAIKIAKTLQHSKELAIETCLQDQLRKAGVNKKVTLVA